LQPHPSTKKCVKGHQANQTPLQVKSGERTHGTFLQFNNVYQNGFSLVNRPKVDFCTKKNPREKIPWVSNINDALIVLSRS